MDQQNDTSFDQNQNLDDECRVRVLSPGMLVFRRFVRNKLAIAGLIILVSMFSFSFLGGLFSPYAQAQVFQRDEMIMKEYASCMVNTDLRYTVCSGAAFPQTAYAQAALAATQGKSSFTSGDKTYSLFQQGENFYTIGELIKVAQARALANEFVLSVDEAIGFSPSAAFASAAQAAMLAGQTQFTADEMSYTLTRAGKTATIYQTQPVALATKHVYDAYTESGQALASDYDFRYAAELARAKGQAEFTLDGVFYSLTATGEDFVIYAKASGAITPVCTVSNMLVSTMAGEGFLPAAFKSAVRSAVRAKEQTFTFADETGETAHYRIDRVNMTYTVRTMTESRVITMFESPTQAHPLGTDGNGMDVLTRLMYGGRISLMVGFVVVFLEMLIGAVVGGISGYFGGWIDTALMRFVDLVNCIPFYPVVLIVGTVMDNMEIDSAQRIFLLMAVLGILGWTGIARVVRGQTLSLREQEFMLAAEATGIRVSRRIFKHLVPNVMPLLIVQATLNLGEIIIAEATLSFLGLGISYPLASWGSMINAATNIHVMTNDWFIWIPAGVLIVLTVLGFNFVGDGLRDAYDPRMKR